MADEQPSVKGVVIALAVGVLLFGLLLEAGIRLVWEETAYGYPLGLHVTDPTKGYHYQPNFRGHFPGQLYSDIEISINSKGMRDREHDYRHGSDGVFRILGVGDSITFGTGLAYEDSYLRQLEKRLSEKGRNVEVIKAGVNGYEFDQQVTYYDEELHKYDVDVVMVEVTLNDARPVDLEKLAARYEESTGFSLRTFVLKSCKSCQFLLKTSKAALRAISGRDYNQEYFDAVFALWEGEGWNRYESKLLDFNARLRSEGKRMILVLFPYTQQFTTAYGYSTAPQQKLAAAARANGISVLDIFPHLDRPDYLDLYLRYDNAHLNAKGYVIVEAAIRAWLDDEAILPARPSS